MCDMSIPVATMVVDSMVESLKSQYDDICEKIKTLRDSYMDFCEDETEFNNAMNPIEKDPEPYSDGTIKTRPILKKYACALLEKNELEVRMEAAEEALRDINLTPQQVKADMKRYVSICEKKIAKQEEVCKELQKQVEQLTEVVKCIVTHPVFNVSQYRKPISVLSHSVMEKSSLAQDFILENSKIEGIFGPIPSYHRSQGDQVTITFPLHNIREVHTSSLHYACSNNDMDCVEKLLKKGANIDMKGYTYTTKTKLYPLNNVINGDKYEYVTPLEIASSIGSLELVKFLLSNGAKIGDNEYLVPNGNVGDLVAGCLQTHGSKPVVRF